MVCHSDSGKPRVTTRSKLLTFRGLISCRVLVHVIGGTRLVYDVLQNLTPGSKSVKPDWSVSRIILIVSPTDCRPRWQRQVRKVEEKRSRSACEIDWRCNCMYRIIIDNSLFSLDDRSRLLSIFYFTFSSYRQNAHPNDTMTQIIVIQFFAVRLKPRNRAYRNLHQRLNFRTVSLGPARAHTSWNNKPRAE